jgi:anti-anti-sigma regulatory factor
MLKLNVEKIGDVAVVHCEGRIVRSEAAFRLRDAVTQQRNVRVVLVDLSSVEALEGGGLGMLAFLQAWSRERGIQFKAFGPPADVRKSLERARSAAVVEIARIGEVLTLLVLRLEKLWGGNETSAQLAPNSGIPGARRGATEMACGPITG